MIQLLCHNFPHEFVNMCYPIQDLGMTFSVIILVFYRLRVSATSYKTLPCLKLHERCGESFLEISCHPFEIIVSSFLETRSQPRFRIGKGESSNLFLSLTQSFQLELPTTAKLWEHLRIVGCLLIPVAYL